MSRLTIRDLERGDMPSLRSIIDQNELFASEMLVPMAEPFLTGGSNHLWLVALVGERVLGLSYVEPERMTEGTYNLLLIAVQPEAQNKGIGKAMVRELSKRLRGLEGRIMLVETSSLDEFSATRAFYEKDGFATEARIRDYYTAGEDKIVFWKRL